MFVLPLVLALAVSSPPVDYQHTMPQNEAVLIALYSEFDPSVVPYLYQIAICESGVKQWSSDGKTIVSPTNDYGILQINHNAWDKTAQSLGLDYKNSLVDNVKMAKVVYQEQGLQAWSCQKKVMS